MALFYYLVDVRGWQKWTFVFRVVGMNSITIYMAQRIMNLWTTSNYFFKGAASHMPELWGNVFVNLGYVIVCWLLLYFLYRKGVFLKV